MKPPVPSTCIAPSPAELRSIDDAIEEFYLLPDESDSDAQQMQAALSSDLAPRTPLEKLIVRDLVDLELEGTRCRRWIQMVIMSELFEPMLAQAQLGGQKGKLTAKESGIYQRSWSGADIAEKRRIIRALSDLGIDPAPFVLDARIKQGQIIDAFEERLRDIAQRRRRLYEDLLRAQSRTRPVIAEAQTLDPA
jgi:hypothetical protein